ncbi:hypothetical protein H5P36_24520 [Bacillus sp. APMAM]|nr:hypothetical protein [Bacillus sp. APMAM]RTZ53248.1 hypothetical protein EKO25_24300 [Bacillus sp. SAJ1]
MELFEKQSKLFNPLLHFKSRMEEMRSISVLGASIAKKWLKMIEEYFMHEAYPVNHPIGQETFSLYVEYPLGIFEYALDIDGAASLIKSKNMNPVNFTPSDCIASVDQGNINEDPKLIQYNHKNPIMVVQSSYLTNKKPFCINGNHRINEAYKNGDKQIKVYVFNDLEFVPFFYDSLSKAMYFFEMDYNDLVKNNVDFTSYRNKAVVDEFYNMYLTSCKNKEV